MTLAEKILRAKQDYDDVFEAGKDSYHDTFWDGFQDYGNRTDYSAAFRGNWVDAIFQPKYDIIVEGANGSQTFQYSKITTLKSKLDELGLKLDTSQASTLLQMFQGAAIKDVPVIDGSNSTSLSYTFGTSSKVETIEKLILSEKLTNVGNAFNTAKDLRHVIFEGTLAITGLDLHWSTKLDAESYHSLMNILSPNTTGMSVTLPAYDTVKAKYDTVYGEGAWDEIVAEKSNWTIAYS